MCWQVPPFSTHVLAAQRWREPQLVRLLLWVLSTCMDACAIVPAPLGGWGGSSGTLYLAWDGSGDSRGHAETHGGDSRRLDDTAAAPLCERHVMKRAGACQVSAAVMDA